MNKKIILGSMTLLMIAQTNLLASSSYSFTRSFMYYQRIFGGVHAKINILHIIQKIQKDEELELETTDDFKEWLMEDKGRNLVEYVKENFKEIPEEHLKKLEKFYKQGKIPKTYKFLKKLWNGFIPAGCGA